MKGTDMNKSTKGALAATAAGFLLLGGAGSLAYWSDSGTVSGTDITSGHLKLDLDNCGDWTLDGEADAFDPAADRVVPGDTLTKTCTYTVDAEGNHLSASFGVTSPTWGTGSSSALTAELTKSASYEVNGSAVTPPSVPVADGDTVTAEITVDFAGASATNASNSAAGLSAALDDITITATQAHS
jgi:alternate signal-mediated exported protein